MQNIQTFISLILQHEYIKNINLTVLNNIMFGIVLTLLPLLLRKYIANFLNNHFKNMLIKFRIISKNIEQTNRALQKPFELIGLSVSLTIFIQYFSFNNYIIKNLHNCLTIIIVFWVFHALTQLLSLTLKKWQKVFSKAMISWLLRALKVLIVLLAIASILEIWGIKVAPILAGLGLFGVAIALGAQDLFKNLIAGILVIAEKRFENKDWIKIDGIVEGTVEHIGFRSTTIRRFDKSPVYVPNAKLSDNVVTNFSRMSHRQIKFTIGLLYSTTVEQLRQVTENINDYIQKNDDFAKEGVTTFVKVIAFNDSSIDIQIYAFTNTTIWTEWLQIREDLITEIKTIVTDAGSDFAYPSTSLYLGEKEKNYLNK